jgi:hypothetical protein
MPITAVPDVHLRIEPGGQYRAMFVNPNQGAAEAPTAVNGGVNTLRVYHTTAPTLPLVRILDVALPFVSGTDATQPTELFFTPPRPGTFVFSWAYVDASATPTPIDVEGPQGNAAQFVYGRLSTLSGILTTQTCFGEETSVSDLMRLNLVASREFEQWTCWHFYPKYLALRVDGEDSFDLRLPYPIIEVIEVRRLDVVSRQSGRVNILDHDEYVVYNRHIAVRNAFDPTRKPSRPDGALEVPGDGTGGVVGGTMDDRRNPRITLVFANEYGRGSQHARSGDIFAPSVRGHHLGYNNYTYAVGLHRGRQNIEVAGFYGYTDADLSVPVGACFATERLALRQATFDLGDTDDVERVLRSHKITMEKTDIHVVQYRQNDPTIGSFTGEPLIDQQIAALARNMGGGHV